MCYKRTIKVKNMYKVVKGKPCESKGRKATGASRHITDVCQPAAALRVEETLEPRVSFFCVHNGNALYKNRRYQVKRVDLMNRSAVPMETKYRFLYNQTPIAVLLVNQWGMVSEANPAAERLFGLSASLLPGREVRSLLVPAAVPCSRQEWELDDKGMPILQGQFDLVVEGASKRIIAQSETLDTEEGRSQCAILQDISEWAKAEEERVRLDYYNERIRKALAGDEFMLHYQPQVNARSGAIVGAEALIRWKDPVKGLIGPDAFIPLAEKSGAVLDIGYWVLDSACRQLTEWRDQGLPPVRMSINLSACQLTDPLFPGKLKEALEYNRLDPSRLCLEITETAALRSEQEAAQICREISKLGVRLIIDDFGMEYSSLSLLRKVDADMIKIDRSFVKDMLHEERDRTIVNAIIALSHGLGKRVIAEGVEAEPQRISLEALGCDEIQGFHISRPVEPGDFAQLLDKNGCGFQKRHA